MENEVCLLVEGLDDKKGPGRITKRIQKMPGIEFVVVNPVRGTVSVTGGDLDQLAIEDAIESLGYRLSR